MGIREAKRETRFPTQLGKFVIRPQSVFIAEPHNSQRTNVGVFLVQRDTNNTTNCGVVHSSLRLRKMQPTKRLNNVILKMAIQ